MEDMPMTVTLDARAAPPADPTGDDAAAVLSVLPGEPSAAWWNDRPKPTGDYRRDAAAFGFDDDLIYREVARPVSRRKIPMKQLQCSDALKVFAEWKRKPDKIRY